MRTFYRSLQHLSPAQLAEAMDLLTRLRAIMVEAASPLSPDEKQTRGMAEKREGYVRLVLRVATNFIDELPRSFNIDECSKLLTAREDWKNLLLKTEETAELAEDTEFAIGVELMRQVDRAAAALNAGRKNNPALDRAMREIDDFNQQFGMKKKESDNTAQDDFFNREQDSL